MDNHEGAEPALLTSLLSAHTVVAGCVLVGLICGWAALKFGDTFGDPVETDSIPNLATAEGPWCNQADGTFEHDDAVRQQGARHKTRKNDKLPISKGNSHDAHES